MRLIRGGPFRHCPECVHHAARSIGKLIRKPPLRTEGSVRSPGESLKIGNPVIGAVRCFLVSHIPRLGVVQRFYGSKPGTMAVATLIRRIATVVLAAASLLGGRQGAMH